MVSADKEVNREKALAGELGSYKRKTWRRWESEYSPRENAIVGGVQRGTDEEEAKRGKVKRLHRSLTQKRDRICNAR